MLGYDLDETQLVSKADSKVDEQGLESNFELTRLLTLTTLADRAEVLDSGCMAIRKQSQGLSLNNWSLKT